ncbi:MAG: carbohydrate-binding domain-containing protein [Actinobacteria bacterium]|nr:carbohydrate-binding domain-containing protein [Actinomycetota bacterium]
MTDHPTGRRLRPRLVAGRLVAASAAVALLATGCSAGSDDGSSDTSASAAQSSTGGSTVVEEAPTSDETIALGSDDLVITEGGNYTLTGDSDAAVVVDTTEDVTLILDGAHIVSGTGAAVEVQEADNVLIYLAEGSENTLEDAGTRDDAEVNGAVYSTADLSFAGAGSLTVTANFEDGIVTKDDLEIRSGTIVVDAVDEGIRGRDSITMTGGDIEITAGDDGFKTTNSETLEKGVISISGGSLTISAGDDAVKAATTITIDGGTIDVLDSVEGIEAINITIDDGNVTVNASDDGINAVAGDIEGDVFIAVNGGVVDVTVGSGDTDAFDANGSITVTGGDITVTAPTSSFDYDTTAEMTGGTITVNGEQLDSIPAGHMGGGGGGGGGRPGR